MTTHGEMWPSCLKQNKKDHCTWNNSSKGREHCLKGTVADFGWNSLPYQDWPGRYTHQPLDTAVATCHRLTSQLSHFRMFPKHQSFVRHPQKFHEATFLFTSLHHFNVIHLCKRTFSLS